MLTLLRALEKLNENFPRLKRQTKIKFRLETIGRDYTSLLKSVVYCWKKIQKSYDVNFIPLLASKLENKLYSLRENLKETLLFELRQLQRNKNRKVNELFLIIKKFVKIERIAKQFLREFGQTVRGCEHLCRRDINLLLDTVDFIRQRDVSLMSEDTERYVFEIKAKIEAKTN